MVARLRRPSSGAGGADDEESEANRAGRARDVYERAFRSVRSTQPDAKAEAVMLLDAWKEFETGLQCG